MTRPTWRRVTVPVVAVVAALGLTGCLQDPHAGGGAGQQGLQGYVDNNQADSDKIVTVLGGFGGVEEDELNKALADFEESSGIDVQYTADTQFSTTIRQRVQSGAAPDIAFFPQPGGMLELAAQGYIQPIDTYLDYDELERTLIPGFLDAARLNGRVYGAPIRMAVKSLVWYPKAAYDKAGYDTEPGTMQELYKIGDKMKADGTAPWCMGWNADANTGWVGTDWLEEYMLRVNGPDVYDDWTSHRMPFNDPKVVKALDAFGELVKTEGNVYGGKNAILNTPYSESILPAFDDPPKCLMERQGNFITSFMPEKIQADLDNEVGLFVLPRLEGGYEGQPILGGGDLAALYNGNDPDAIEVMKFLTSDKFGGSWAKAGGWLSPHSTFDTSLYPDEVTKKTGQIAADADVFRFDGSDLMPNAVGAGSFWTGMVDWINGADSKTVLDKIEASWPKDEKSTDSSESTG